jgi:hypothetical protein
MKHLSFLFLLNICSVFAFGQTINGYAKVTGITGTTVLNINSVDESADTFEDGEFAIIMQMQDDVIGTNTNNNSSFGDLSSIGSAGVYEVVQILSHTESSGSPNTITLVNPISQTYSFNVNSSVQIITFPTYGSPNYTTVSDISAKGWNGSIGGVVAFEVPGVLTLSHNITANNSGFRGGVANGGGSTGCSGGSNYRVNTGSNSADKGEGIFKVTASNFAAGRAKIINGGGGGNSHNAGGGGGSNFSAGGIGGPGWPNCTPSAGGMGGVDLSSEISGNRIFMGGGGGSGEGNNGVATGGGYGGGIILIKAEEITSACGSGVSITANGETITSNSGNDGSGGAGAAGTILFEVNNWNLTLGCPLTINNNGGDGGDVVSGAWHGGGGGGGLGPIIFSTIVPTTNVIIDNSPGQGGLNCSTCPTTNGGSGTSGSGIIGINTNPLPIQLLNFKVNLNKELMVDISWSTKSEINNDYFNIERSIDGDTWVNLIEVNGAGNSSEQLDYEVLDSKPFSGISYYRLKQTDFNGNVSYSQTQTIIIESISGESIVVYPNPVKNKLTIEGNNLSKNNINILNTLGQIMISKYSYLEFNKSIAVIDLGLLPKGVYYIKANNDVVRFTKL